MPFCSRCGVNVPPGTIQCPRCGLMLNSPPPGQGCAPPPAYQQQNMYPPVQQPYYHPYPMPMEPGSRRLSVGMLVWSIILMVTFYGFVFGLIALIMTILAKDEVYAQGERGKLKVAKVLNIIGTVIIGLIVLGILSLIFLFDNTYSSYYYY